MHVVSASSVGDSDSEVLDGVTVSRVARSTFSEGLILMEVEGTPVSSASQWKQISSCQ